MSPSDTFTVNAEAMMFTVNVEAMFGLQPAEDVLLKIKFTPKDISEKRVNCSGFQDDTVNYSPMSIFP